MREKLDSSEIDRAVEEISELINLAPLGLADWNDIPQAMTRLFPGSFSGLQNADLVNNSLPFLEVVGLDESALVPYIEYYHGINPYERYWRAHKSKHVWTSDYVLPTTVLGKNEFYNDWMGKIGEFDSATGVKLDATAENEIRFNIQFPTRFLESYERPVTQLITRLRNPLCRAVEMSRQVVGNQISIATTAALLDRKDKAACILDVTRTLRDANSNFEQLLRTKSLFQSVNGRIETLNHQHLGAFSNLIQSNALSASAQNSKIILRDELDDWIISCARLPSPIGKGPVAHRPLVLVLVTRIGSTDDDLNLLDFSHAYNLTKSEQFLCQALASGRSLSDSAIFCGISYETARSRIKDIFHKTHTTKQADLYLMLEQFRTS